MKKRILRKKRFRYQIKNNHYILKNNLLSRLKLKGVSSKNKIKSITPANASTTQLLKRPKRKTKISKEENKAFTRIKHKNHEKHEIHDPNELIKLKTK